MAAMWPRFLACAAAIAWCAAARADDPTAAQSAYDRAKQLESQGKLAEACALFETSYRADPQLGALLNAADCNEKIGHTATA